MDDKSSGNGKYIHLNGTIYEGEWANDKQEGFGVERWPDEAYYVGSYVTGMKHGYG